MLQQNTRALAQPQNLFDFSAHTAHALAAIGTAVLALAHAVDDAVVARRDHTAAHPPVRPRDRLGPETRHPAELGVPDAWRAR